MDLAYDFNYSMCGACDNLAQKPCAKAEFECYFDCSEKDKILSFELRSVCPTCKDITSLGAYYIKSSANDLFQNISNWLESQKFSCQACREELPEESIFILRDDFFVSKYPVLPGGIQARHCKLAS
ncbi:MAG: hypothetical protein ABIA04_08845 [Pseudomonadota bacterium]